MSNHFSLFSHVTDGKVASLHVHFLGFPVFPVYVCLAFPPYLVRGNFGIAAGAEEFVIAVDVLACN